MWPCHRGMKEMDAALPTAAAGEADDVTAQPVVRTLLAALDRGLGCCDGDGCATPPRVSDDMCSTQKIPFETHIQGNKAPTAAASSSSFRNTSELLPLNCHSQAQ